LGTESGDLLLAILAFESGSSVNLITPTGWTLIKITNNTTNLGLATYWKIAGSIEPNSYSFSSTGGKKWSLGISRITGVSKEQPIAGYREAIGTVATFNVDAPSVTSTEPNQLVVAVYTNKKATIYTPMAGTTERFDRPNTTEGLPSLMKATYYQANPGQTGIKRAISQEKEIWAAQQILINSGSRVLPVNFLYFRINYSEKTREATLTWATAKEEQNEYFEVERAINGLQLWESLGKIPGKGTTDTTQNYSFPDKRMPLVGGWVYYRVKQVDTDGSSDYTPVKSIQIAKIKSEKAWAIYPNPIEGGRAFHLDYLQFTQKIETPIGVHAVELHGSKVFHELVENPKDVQDLINAHLSEKKPGIYLITLTWNKTNQQLKLVVF
jgi:hypothetical protein